MKKVEKRKKPLEEAAKLLVAGLLVVEEAEVVVEEEHQSVRADMLAMTIVVEVIIMLRLKVHLMKNNGNKLKKPQETSWQRT